MPVGDGADKVRIRAALLRKIVAELLHRIAFSGQPDKIVIAGKIDGSQFCRQLRWRSGRHTVAAQPVDGNALHLFQIVVSDIGIRKRQQVNVLDVTASRGTINVLGIVFIAGIPLVILIAGLVIFLKRRHL